MFDCRTGKCYHIFSDFSISSNDAVRPPMVMHAGRWPPNAPSPIIMRRLSQAVIWMIVKVPTGHTRIRHPSSSVLAIGAPTNIAYKNRLLRLSIRLLRALTVSQPVSWRVTASRMLRRALLTTSSVVPDVPVQQATYPPRTDSQFWTFLSGYPLLCDDSLLPDIGHVRLRDRLRQT
ncbi:hypothetical protein BD626DRAFT_520412 [Schizophyllum amplum]|uniref:Uncharacterized protein n=1 Tax=Schizophyllum amplum TaxID=97359 RepID=A0A550BUK2_9AGAR|nr:hypothetical protein BD626DRAFT_520412 [Auriculariopsis ampla]